MNAIFLIGYMGSGKSTTGKILANQLGCSFIDLDSFIEEIEQKSIPDIFSLFGEETFRLIEHNALKKLIKQNGNAVIACGGGTPCFHDNISLMNNAGLTIYIKLSPETLQNRLLVAKEKRPLIENKSSDALLIFIKEQLAGRSAFYAMAETTIDAENMNATEVAQLINKKIERG